jgi:hypothetical protein
MPAAPRRRCAHPGCRERQVAKRCPKHELVSPRNHGGVSRHARGLGAVHDRNRRAIRLAGRPCELRLPGCTGIATSPEHRLPRSRGGTNDPANVGAACLRCQNVQGGRLSGFGR